MDDKWFDKLTMKDKDFKEMDQSLMKRTEPLREQKISEGILKGFSASVERRLPDRQAGISGGSTALQWKSARRLVWVPTFAVMVLASVAVLRSPIAPSLISARDTQEIQLAQAVAPADEMQDEIAVLTELGVLDEAEDADLLGEEELLLDENMELTKNVTSSSAIG